MMTCRDKDNLESRKENEGDITPEEMKGLLLAFIVGMIALTMICILHDLGQIQQALNTSMVKIPSFI